MRVRPLSPHLSVYRMSRYCLITSFANRIAGGALSAGLLVFIYWLTSLARGGRAYGRAQQMLGSGAAKVIYVAVIAAFAYHLAAGIRHLIWDTGRGMEKVQSQRSAWLVIAVAAAVTLVCVWRAL
jgi:succinate dehydrogenase / fumarate reductase cytochrome b subunit